MLQKLEKFQNQGKKRGQSEPWYVSAVLWTMRLTIWIFVVGVLVGIGFAIFFSLDNIQVNNTLGNYFNLIFLDKKER